MKIRNTSILIATSIFLIFSSFTSADNIYISCYGSGTIEKLDSSGNRSTVASGLYHPTGLALDSNKNLYIARPGTGTRNGTIVKIDPAGNKSNFATNLRSPQGLSFDSKGNLFLAEWYDDAIYKYDSSGNMSVFSAEQIWHPEGLTFDSSGNLWAASYRSTNAYSAIYKYDSAGNSTAFAWDHVPIGLAFDRNGHLFAANSADGTIMKYDSRGNGTTYASGFNSPYGITFDSSGNLFMADMGAGIIYKYDTFGNGSVFASGLNQPAFIVAEVPEPATLLLFTLGGLALRRKQKTA